MLTPIRTLLIDDNSEFLDLAVRFLSENANIEVVGRLSSGKDALEQLSNVRPDLVLMDLAMAEMNGLEATRRIKTLVVPPKVIVLTLHDHSVYRKAAMDAGADGFVSKTDFATALLPFVYRLFDDVQKEVSDK